MDANAGSSGVTEGAGIVGSAGVVAAVGVVGSAGVAGASGVIGSAGVAGSSAVVGSAGVALSLGVVGSAGVLGGLGNVGCAGCVGCIGCVNCRGASAASAASGSPAPSGASARGLTPRRRSGDRGVVRERLQVPALGGADGVAHPLPPVAVAVEMPVFELHERPARTLGGEPHLDLAGARRIGLELQRGEMSQLNTTRPGGS